MNRAKMLIGLLLLAATCIGAYFLFPQDQPKKSNPASSQNDYIQIARPNGETYNLPIQEVKEYDTYLSREPDREAEVNRTQYEVLSDSDKNMLVLLKYSCGNKQCITQLIKISDSENVASLLLPTAIFQDYKFSANHEKVLLIYATNEGNIVRNQIVALDIVNMSVLSFQSSALEEEYAQSPKWPITDYEWVSDNEIKLQIADVSSSSFESLEQWFSSGGERSKPVNIILSENGFLAK